MEVSLRYQMLPLFLVMTSFIIVKLSKFACFVEHNISYQPCKLQLSRMSGSNFTEGGVENTPSAAPGGKSPVLLGLQTDILSYAL